MSKRLITQQKYTKKLQGTKTVKFLGSFGDSWQQLCVSNRMPLAVSIC